MAERAATETAADGRYRTGYFLTARTGAAAISLLIFALYSAYSYFQYRHFITPSWDLGIFAQLAQEYSQLHFPPIVEIKGAGYNLWGDHFHPILILLGPLYRLFPSPDTLLYLQNGLVALSVYILCRYAQKIVGALWGVILAAAYGLSYGIQSAVAAQFHEVAFALPFLVISLGYIVLSRDPENRPTLLARACWWALPLVFVKEDLGVTAAMIGLVALIRSGWLKTAADILFPHPGQEVRRGQRWRRLIRSWAGTGAVAESTLLMVWGVVWSALAMRVIVPLFNARGVFDYADRVDPVGALADPLQTFGQMFFPWEKSISIWLLLLAGVFIWVSSPIALVALPTLAWRFLSGNEGYWQSTWHYSLVLMPVVFMGLLDYLARNRYAAATVTARGLVADYRKNARYLLPVLCLIIALGMLPNQPLASLTQKTFATGTLSTADQSKQRVVETIPAGSTVAADLSVLTYLVPQHTVYWIGHEGEPAPDYLVLDLAGSSWNGNPPRDPVAYAEERFGYSYTLAERIGTIYVVRRM